MVVESLEISLREPLVKLARDVKQAANQLSRREARWLVDTYYMLQEDRKRSKMQADKCAEQAEPNQLIGWVFGSMERFEAAVKGCLGAFAKRWKVGQWLQAQTGIGPVLSAACLTYFDIRKAPAMGHFWSFAGLSPDIKWEKGQKRPYCADLKSIMAFRLGETMVKFQNHPQCFYGRLFAEKKAELWQQNVAGAFAATARQEADRHKKDTEAYKWKAGWFLDASVQAALEAGHSATEVEPAGEGNGMPMLPPGQIHNRARRWMVKLVIAHVWEVMYVDYHGTEPPDPYIFAHPRNGQHVHRIAPPLWPGEYNGRPLRELLV